jgi:hypothetical protein
LCSDGGVAKEHSVSNAADAIASSAAANMSTNSSAELKMDLFEEFNSKPDKKLRIIKRFLWTVSGTVLTSSRDLAGVDTSCRGVFLDPVEFDRSTGPTRRSDGYRWR